MGTPVLILATFSQRASRDPPAQSAHRVRITRFLGSLDSHKSTGHIFPRWRGRFPTTCFGIHLESLACPLYSQQWIKQIINSFRGLIEIKFVFVFLNFFDFCLFFVASHTKLSRFVQIHEEIFEEILSKIKYVYERICKVAARSSCEHLACDMLMSRQISTATYMPA